MNRNASSALVHGAAKETKRDFFTSVSTEQMSLGVRYEDARSGARARRDASERWKIFEHDGTRVRFSPIARKVEGSMPHCVGDDAHDFGTAASEVRRVVGFITKTVEKIDKNLRLKIPLYFVSFRWASRLNALTARLTRLVTLVARHSSTHTARVGTLLSLSTVTLWKSFHSRKSIACLIKLKRGTCLRLRTVICWKLV